MPNLGAISQATTEINRGVDSTPQALTASNHPGEIGLTYVPTTVVVAVVVDSFFVGKFWFFASLCSHGWYRPCPQAT